MRCSVVFHDDMPTETTTLDPLDAAQLEDCVPVGQQEQLFGVSMSEDACNGTHGTEQLETVSDITITTACSDDGPSSSHNGGTNP